MENPPSLPRAPKGLDNRRRLRQEALARLALEESRFAATDLPPAPVAAGTRRGALRRIGQAVFALAVATLAGRRLIPSAWAGSSPSQNIPEDSHVEIVKPGDPDPDNSPGQVYGGPDLDDNDTTYDPKNPSPDPETPPGNVYGGPDPDDDDSEPTPAQPDANKPPAPVYGGPAPGKSN